MAILCLEADRTPAVPPDNFDFNKEMENVSRRVADAKLATSPTLDPTGSMTPIINV